MVFIQFLSFFRAGQLTWHNGKIPQDKLFVKIGGDHGQGSMKFEFQLANVIKPNSSKKNLWYLPFMKARTPGTISKRYFNIMLIH